MSQPITNRSRVEVIHDYAFKTWITSGTLVGVSLFVGNRVRSASISRISQALLVGSYITSLSSLVVGCSARTYLIYQNKTPYKSNFSSSTIRIPK